MSPIMTSGSQAATSFTKSKLPFSRPRRSSSALTTRTRGSRSITRRGVKPLLTSERRFLCSGSSMSIM